MKKNKNMQEFSHFLGRHLGLTTDNNLCVRAPQNLDSDEKTKKKEEEIIHLIQDTSFVIKIK